MNSKGHSIVKRGFKRGEHWYNPVAMEFKGDRKMNFEQRYEQLLKDFHGTQTVITDQRDEIIRLKTIISEYKAMIATVKGLLK